MNLVQAKRIIEKVQDYREIQDAFPGLPEFSQNPLNNIAMLFFI
jgi:hypothetical protein